MTKAARQAMRGGRMSEAIDRLLGGSIQADTGLKRSGDASLADTGEGIGALSARAAGRAEALQGIAATVERNIVPRLVENARSGGGRRIPAETVDALTKALLANDARAVRATLEGARASGASIDALQLDLLAPAARVLGEAWEDDECDFTTVYLGIEALRGFMAENHSTGHAGAVERGRGRRALMAATPGEQHIFGVEMAADFFMRAGWHVTCRPSASHAEIVRLASREWYDVIGFSIAADRNLRALADVVRALRRVSFNPSLQIMVGGPGADRIQNVRETTGADWVASDIEGAVAEASVRLEIAADT